MGSHTVIMNQAEAPVTWSWYSLFLAVRISYRLVAVHVKFIGKKKDKSNLQVYLPPALVHTNIQVSKTKYYMKSRQRNYKGKEL